MLVANQNKEFAILEVALVVCFQCAVKRPQTVLVRSVRDVAKEILQYMHVNTVTDSF